MSETAGEISDLVARGRREMEALMLDRCKITRAGAGERVFDEASMTYTDPPRTTVYEGPCRVQIKADINSNVIEATSGEREWTYQTATLQVPIAGTEGIRVDDVAEMTVATLDPALLGRRFNLEGVYRKSQSTCRRYRVKEVTG